MELPIKTKELEKISEAGYGGLGLTNCYYTVTMSLVVNVHLALRESVDGFLEFIRKKMQLIH